MNETKGFQRTIEDFICEHCGAQVAGNGYTNHCPHCLWSKHVDVNPGDRSEVCRGMMKPIGIETKGGLPVRIIHKCIACGYERAATIRPEDNWEEMQKLSE